MRLTCNVESTTAGFVACWSSSIDLVQQAFYRSMRPVYLRNSATNFIALYLFYSLSILIKPQSYLTKLCLFIKTKWPYRSMTSANKLAGNTICDSTLKKSKCVKFYFIPCRSMVVISRFSRGPLFCGHYKTMRRYSRQTALECNKYVNRSHD